MSHGRKQDDRQASFLLSSETRAPQSYWPFKPNQLSVPAVVGKWTMGEVAIYSNFISSCHSREIQCLSSCVISVILYTFPVFPYDPPCRSGVNSLCVLSLFHFKPNQLTAADVVTEWMVWEARVGTDSNFFFSCHSGYVRYPVWRSDMIVLVIHSCYRRTFPLLFFTTL